MNIAQLFISIGAKPRNAKLVIETRQLFLLENHEFLIQVTDHIHQLTSDMPSTEATEPER